MPRLRTLIGSAPLATAALGLAAWLAAACPARGQITAGATSAAIARPGASNPAIRPRVFAPGVLTVVPPSLDPAETASRHDVVEITAQPALRWTPQVIAPSRTLVAMATDARFERKVWCLELAIKPLRMIRLTTASGEPRLVWYLVYRVANTGAALEPTADESNGRFEAKPVDSGPVRFVPHFVLQGQDVAPGGGKVYRSYLDQPIPGAVEAIARRESPGVKLGTSTSLPLAPLAVGQEAWGVAMWEGIDPEMDFFSVFVRGLTNAYQWTDPAGVFAAGDPPGKGREFARKTLQLNFWRPGDRFLQHEGEIRYGVPPGKAELYGVAEGVAHQWVYR